MQNELPLKLIKNPDNPRCSNALRRLSLYDFSLITESCIDKFGWTVEEAEAIELQTKQFLALPFLDPHFFHIPEEKVDEYWHRMILHTQWYHAFCEETYGFYLHHTPEPRNKTPDLLNRNRTAELGKVWFGVNWSDLVRTCTQCNRSCVLSAITADDKHLIE